MTILALFLLLVVLASVVVSEDENSKLSLNQDM
jgi:hypothetical protein